MNILAWIILITSLLNILFMPATVNKNQKNILSKCIASSSFWLLIAIFAGGVFI